MPNVKQVISEKLVCFECNGDLDLVDDALVCKNCASRRLFSRNSLSYDSSSFKTQYGRQYGEDAHNYERSHSLNEGFSIGVALTIKKALERVTPLPAYCALEVGCGTGVLTRGCNYHGIAKYFLATDISREMLDEAARKETSDNVLYLVQDVCKLNIKDESFDIVVGTAILHHLLRVESGLAEIVRVLTRDGVAVFQEPFYHGNQFVAFLMSVVVECARLQRRHSGRQMRALAESIQAYSDTLQFMYENRHTPEKLEAFDDKHLFTHQDVKTLARDVGFRDVEIVSPWHLNPPTQPNTWKEITKEVIEALKNQAGLGKLRIDYTQIPFLETIDGLIGSELLEHMPPQAIVVFQK